MPPHVSMEYSGVVVDVVVDEAVVVGGEAVVEEFGVAGAEVGVRQADATTASTSRADNPLIAPTTPR